MVTNIERIKVDLLQLSVGLPLKYDLQSMHGTLVAKAGTVVTSDLKLQWQLDGLRFAEAIVSDRSDSDTSTDSTAVAPHDPVVLERLETTFNKASDYVLHTGMRIARGESAGASQAKNLALDLKAEIAADVATALTAFAKSLSVELTDNDQLVSQRSSQLSVLALLLAKQLQFSEDDQLCTAMAGMFHDVALLDCIRRSDQRISEVSYFNHASLSASLFDSAIGNHPKVSIAISQVHEQIDGTGFPKQLRAERIIPIARILGVADAYLTLTLLKQPELFPQSRAFHPADAVGYLMYHAARGRFDRKVVRALIDVASLYPVGCRVELSDTTTAVVMRSSAESPSKPIVRIESAASPIIDLRRSPLFISRPTLSPMDHCSRLKKSKIGEVYWRL